MYKIWQNPSTLDYWIVDELGRGYPGPIVGPYRNKEAAEAWLKIINKADSEEDKRENDT